MADLAGVETPSDSDGISMTKELFGKSAEQRQHQYLYWELGAKRAVRMQNWKATRPSQGKAWELYDLSVDPSETNDLSKENPEMLEKLQQFAKDAHQPAVPGTFSDRTLHERDRQAKQGFKK
jgi:arylsulfatase A-like enzyme